MQGLAGLLKATRLAAGIRGFSTESNPTQLVQKLAQLSHRSAVQFGSGAVVQLGNKASHSNHAAWVQFCRSYTSPTAVQATGQQLQHGFAAHLLVRKATHTRSSGLGAALAARLRAQSRRFSTVTAGAAGPVLRASQAYTTAAASGLAAGLPRHAQRAVAWWLAGCAGWVFSMVVLGGVTRLTRSGLSMTDWKLAGERPPRSACDWEAEFAKYKASPEFQKVNRSMRLDEFKFIYWMEYAHRMWGRVLGLAFAGPALVFAARGYINRPLAQRLGLLFLMGGTQGLVGWWMVRSGLEAPPSEWDVPRVSPYRLAAHLTSAVVIYSMLMWTALTLAFPVPSAAMSSETAAAGAAVLRRWAHPVTGIIALTALSGAFVAGMDAGHAYNTFPKMAGRWVPEDYFALPGWRNAFENTAAVQFHHRVLAVTTLTSVGTLWWAHRAAVLPRPARLLLNGLAVMTAAQVTLGISTLLLHVPPLLLWASGG
ncbi:hypothetical protein WJX72_002648 [[Myrmecia] bisecta]|uniref:Uncharacterized protein n=1 Tax=[Myrmecia] bisecta TaxID=41462 RepID=A0AAW1PF85_9CHLO